MTEEYLLAPFNDEVPAKQRTETAIAMSELVMKIATHIICHTLVDYQEQLSDERLSVAHAFLQRVTSTHLCNHKLTTEGIVYEYLGQPFLLPEEYKTLTLTRTAYEHLAMFYFLFERPKSEAERDVVWKYWQVCSKKNLLDGGIDDDEQLEEHQVDLIEEIELLRQDILSSPIVAGCRQKLDEWTKIGNTVNSGSIMFTKKHDRYDVRRISYSQACRLLFRNDDMTQLYRYLSMHCHPVYDGLRLYQFQPTTNQGEEALSLYFSCTILAHLCRLFLKQLPDGRSVIARAFSRHERALFDGLATM